MINNAANGTGKRLESVIGTVYEPVSGWSYAHHAFITHFCGKFRAIWSNGTCTEDDFGQRVMMAESCDGEHWENIRPVVTPEMLGNRKAILTAAGFYIHGNMLHVYYGYFSYARNALREDGGRPLADAGHENTMLGVVSTADCCAWSEPKKLGICMVANHGPQATASGRLIISGNTVFPYTDNPNGTEDYRITGIYGNAFTDTVVRDDSESIRYVSDFNGWKDRLICEGSFFQTDDCILHMMLRSNAGYLWCSESSDDGETWSVPFKTDFINDGSKFHFGRLPDGRFYCVSNARLSGDRNPLELHIAQDGENFHTYYVLRDEPYEMKSPDLRKGGLYGYPHTLIHEGYMYVIYSKRKEVIEVTKFNLEQL